MVAAQAKALALNIAFSLLATAVIQLAVYGFDKFIHAAKNASDAAKEAADKAREDSDKYKEEAKTIDELISKYKELANSDTQDSTTRSEIKDIQAQIVNLVGEQAGNLDLVNGKLDDELAKLQKISKEEAKKALESANASYVAARKESNTAIGKESRWFGFVDGYEYSGKTSFSDKDIRKVLGDYYQVFSDYNPFTKSYGINLYEQQGLLDLFNIDTSTIQNKIDVLEEVKNRLSTLAGFSNDELYNGVIGAIDYYQEILDKETSALDQTIEAATNYESFDDDLNKIVVDSADKYEEYRQKLIDLVSNNDEISEKLASGDITTEQIESFITDKMASMGGVFSDYYQEWYDIYSEYAKKMASDMDNMFKKGLGLDGLSGSSLAMAKNYSEYKKITKWFDNLSSDKKKIVYDIALNDSEGLSTLEDWKRKIKESTSFAEIEFIKVAENVNALNTSISAVQEVLNSQSTGKSLTLENFNAEELKNYTSALEYHNGVLQLNKEKVSEIIKENSELQIAENNRNKALRQSEYLENARKIQQLRDELNNCTDATDEHTEAIRRQIDQLRTENDGLLNQCQQYDLMTNSIIEATSAYQNWINAQSASQSGEMFDGALSALEKINDTLNKSDSDSYMKVGNADYKAAIEFLVPDTVDSKDKDAVRQYIKSIESLLTFDDNGKANGLNIQAVYDKALNAGLVELDKKTGEYSIAGKKSMEEFAKGLDLSLPLVQAVFGELEEYDIKFDWSDELFSTFGDGIVEAQKQIAELESEIDSLERQKEAGVNIDDSKIKKAKKSLEELKEKKEELSEKSAVNIETNMDLEDKLKKAKKNLTKIQAGIDIGISEKDAQAKLDKIQNKLNKLQKPTVLEIQAHLGDLNAQLEEVQSKIDIIENEIKINPSAETEKTKLALEELNKQKESLEAKIVEIETYAETKKANDDLDDLNNKKIDDKDFKVNAITENAEKAIDNIKNKLKSIPDTKTVEITTTEKKQTIIDKVINKITGGKHSLNGSAHVSGTAKASGDWRDKQGGTTLVGELGREIIVNPYTGKWYTVGDNGAEFVNVPKNSIIFNHKQTEDLLKHGSTTSRALALAKGTAFVSGNAKVSGGNVSLDFLNSLSKRKGYNTYSSTVTNQRTSSTKATDDNTNATNKNTDAKKANTDQTEKEKTALEQFQEWIGKFFDWIEVRVDRVQSKIDKFVEKAENAAEDNKYARSGRNYRKAIKQTETLINVNRKGSARYMEQAETVSNKAVSDGVISKAEMEEIQKLVKNGKIDIRQYNEEQQEVIKDYKDLYDKSKNCSDAIRGLNRNIKEYYTSLYNLPLDKAANKIEKLSSKLEVLSAKADAVTGGSQVYDKVVVKDVRRERNIARKELKETRKQNKSEISKTSKDLMSSDKLTKEQKKKVAKRDNINVKGLTGDVLKDAKEYNKAIAQITKAEKRFNDANKSYKQAVNNRKKNKNASSYKAANDILDDETKIAKRQNKVNQDALRQASKNYEKINSKFEKNNKKMTTNVTTLLGSDDLTKKQKNAIKNAQKNGKKINTSNLTGDELKAANDYNKALKSNKDISVKLTAAQKSYKDSLTKAQISQAEYTTTIRENTQAKLDNINNTFESKSNLHQSKIDNKLSKLENRKKNGEELTRDDYDSIIKEAQKEASDARKQLKAFDKWYKKNKKNLTADEKRNAKSQRQNLKQAINDADTAVLDYQSDAIQAEIDNEQNKLDMLKAEGDLLSNAYEQNKNINQQIAVTINYYDDLIEQEKNATKKAQLRAEKEKAIRDLMVQQLDNIKAQMDAYVNLQNAISSVESAKEDVNVARGTDNSSSRYNSLINDSYTQRNNASEIQRSAADYLNQLKKSYYVGNMDEDGNLVKLSYREYQEGLTTYNEMIASMYKAQAQAAQDQYDAWVALYFNPMKQAYDDLKNRADIENANIGISNVKGLSTTAWQYQSLINNASSQISNLRSQNDLIRERMSLYDSESEKYQELKDQLNSNNKAILDCQKSQIEWNNAIIQIPFDNIQKVLDKLDAIKENYESLLSINDTKGISRVASEYSRQIGQLNDEIVQYTKERNLAWDNYQRARYGEGVYGGKTYDEWYIECTKYDTAINNLQKDIEEYRNAIVQIPFDNIEKVIDKLDSLSENRKSKVDLKSALGYDLDVNDYLEQIQDNNDKINQYIQDRTHAYNDYLTALANPNKVYGGKTADEWISMYYDFDTQVNNLTKSNEELKDALRDDVYWRTYEKAHDAAKRFSDILSGIKDLIDGSMYFDSNGNLTKWGNTQIANLVSLYESARNEVQNYSNDIQNLNKLYSQGYYTQDEYTDKLKEIQSGMLDSASSMKSYINEIKDMYKDLEQSEIDSLTKLIDKRAEAMRRKKEYYDYDKSIKDKTKDIQSLEAQISALENVETLEARAKKARLEAQLSEAKEDLNDTIMNHSFELSEQALDELKTVLQDEFDDKWNNMWQNFDDVQKLLQAANELTTAQSSNIDEAINQLLSFFGINSRTSGISQYTGYASGTKRVDKDKLAWTQENGKEIIVRKSDGAILTPLSKGDSVIPNNLSNNLFDWGLNSPKEFADSLFLKTPVIPNVQSHTPSIEQHIDSLLTVEGNVDSTVVTDLNKFAKQFCKTAYDYTIKEMTRDARKVGVKP